MQCVRPSVIKVRFKDKPTKELTVPCGQCFGCRKLKQKEWSLRLKHELHYFEDACFITLTYDEMHVPENDSLRKTDLQKFFKRLRKDLSKKGKKIKYFACGEYGKDFGRPHYHAIIFGLSLSKEDKNDVMANWPYCNWSVTGIKKGSFGLVEDGSINYVSGYINKKLNGEMAEEYYYSQGKEPVFKLASNGLGARWAEDNKEDIETRQAIIFKGREIGIPRYYIKKLGLNTEHLELKAQEKDCDIVEHFTGVYVSEDIMYKHGEHKDVLKLVKERAKARIQNERNIEAKSKIKQSKL